jgi:acid phosphatase
MVIVEENRSFEGVIGSPSAPYVNSLANHYGLAARAHAQSHPSLPNYLELISGSTHGISDDGTGYQLSGTTLANQLSDNGVDWRAYMEAMPSACYSGAGGGGYAKKHDPFMYFTAITGNNSTCSRIVPFSQFTADIGSNAAPSFAFVVPSLCHDGHDCSTAVMDSWLSANLTPVLASAWFAQHGVVILTWDEGTDSSGCCVGAHGGHVATVVVSHDLGAHVQSDQPVDHAGILRTVELYGLPYLGDAACACSGDLGTLIATVEPATLSGLTWLTVAHRR